MKKTLLAGALVAGLSTAAVAGPSLTINGAYNSNTTSNIHWVSLAV
jgi:hypothetical protein